MKVKVRLFGDLSELLPQNRKDSISDCQVEVKQGSKVINVLNKLGLPIDTPKIILINGKAFPKAEEKTVREDDILSIFPPVAGG